MLGEGAPGSLATRVERALAGVAVPIGISRMRIPMKTRLANTAALESQSAARLAASLSIRLNMSPTCPTSVG